MVRKVCIVGSGSLASNPRLLKEADALHEAGYEVTAVCCDYTDALRAADDEIVRSVPWQVRRVPRPALGRYTTPMARAVARLIEKLRLPVPVALAAEAYGGPFRALRSGTTAIKADLYIAHYVPSLPAAAAAARRHRALLGFDAEDFHSGEGTDSEVDTLRMRMVERIEGAILPSCASVTAASPLIARAYARRYGIATPATVLNVFPLGMAPAMAEVSAPEAGALRAYWFSQTIGLDRGLQSFLQGMSRASAKVTLDIRGSDRWGHGDSLLALARELGLADRVRLLPLAAPDEMVRLAASYDVGLSLETEASESRRLCLTNKIFTYLLAGVPVVMSDTPAQRVLALDLGAAASLVSLADPEEIAAVLDHLATPRALAVAKSTASHLGRERYNWDREKSIMLDTVASAFALQDRKHA
jgi:glycosyltransferase involved in cell wall biosynthesis